MLFTLIICRSGLLSGVGEDLRRQRPTLGHGTERRWQRERRLFLQYKMLALCLLNELSLGSCFGVLIEGDRQRTFSGLIFISPTFLFHLYLWTWISKREGIGISPSCHPASGCDRSRAARKLNIRKIECVWLYLSRRLSEWNPCCLQDFCSHLNLSPLNLETWPSGFHPACTGRWMETKIPR